MKELLAQKVSKSFPDHEPWRVCSCIHYCVRFIKIRQRRQTLTHTHTHTHRRTCMRHSETWRSSCISITQANINEEDNKKSTPIMHAVSLHDQNPWPEPQRDILINPNTCTHTRACPDLEQKRPPRGATPGRRCRPSQEKSPREHLAALRVSTRTFFLHSRVDRWLDVKCSDGSIPIVCLWMHMINQGGGCEPQFSHPYHSYPTHINPDLSEITKKSSICCSRMAPPKPWVCVPDSKGRGLHPLGAYDNSWVGFLFVSTKTFLVSTKWILKRSRTLWVTAAMKNSMGKTPVQLTASEYLRWENSIDDTVRSGDGWRG